VWINPFPYHAPERILTPVVDIHNRRDESRSFSVDEYLTLLDAPTVASAVAHTAGGTGVVLMAPNRPTEVVAVRRVSGNTSAFLGVPAKIGRFILPADVRENGDTERVAVLSFSLWQRGFDADPAVIGRTISLWNEPFVVVGVMPQRFGWGLSGLQTTDAVWLPWSSKDRSPKLKVWLRLANGISEQKAAQETGSRLSALQPTSMSSRNVSVTFRRLVDGDSAQRTMRGSLLLLLCAVACLLLVSCSAVAHLQLARGAVRSRDIAVKVAIGASRSRVFGELLADSMIVAAAACAIGLALAYAFTTLSMAVIPPEFIPIESEVVINTPVLGLALALTAMCGVAFGVLPAIYGVRLSVADALRGHLGGRSAPRLQAGLVMAEVAASFVLVAASSVAIRQYIGVSHADLGFNPERLIVVPFDFRLAQNLVPADFFRSVLPRLHRVGPIASAAVSQDYRVKGYQIAGEPSRYDTELRVRVISASYQDTMQLRLTSGRFPSSEEIEGGAPVAVVNRTASELWPSTVPVVGSSVSLQLYSEQPAPIIVSIVGVTQDIRDAVDSWALAEAPARPVPTISVPLSVRRIGNASLLLRTRHEEPLRVMRWVRQQVYDMDPRVVLLKPIAFEPLYGRGRLHARFRMALLGILGAVALSLALAGVCALLLFHVACRRREIGIRVALGAAPSRVTAMVVLFALRVVAVGAAIGAVLSVALHKLVASVSMGLGGVDLTATMAAAAVFVCGSILACYFPVRRALRTDPQRALRAE
jgi:predicted permease